jgi:hypothetical protein
MSQSGKIFSNTGPGGVIQTLTGDAGGAIQPNLGNVDILGGSNITTTGTLLTHDITIDVSGTTDHALQIGNNTGSLTSLAVGLTGTILTGVTGADATWTTATYPATTLQGDLLYSSAANTITGLVKDINATRYLSNTGVNNNPLWAQINLSNGVTNVLPIANGGTNSNAMVNTYGVNYFDGTSIVTTTIGVATQVLTSNGIGSAPTFQPIPGGIPFPWTTIVGANVTLQINHGYMMNRATLITAVLPAASATGDVIKITGIGVGGYTVTQNAGQIIHLGVLSTTPGVGGSVSSTHDRDSLEMVCVVDNLEFNVVNSFGNLSIV